MPGHLYSTMPGAAGKKDSLASYRCMSGSGASAGMVKVRAPVVKDAWHRSVRQRLFLLTGRGRFLFGKTKRKWGRKFVLFAPPGKKAALP